MTERSNPAPRSAGHEAIEGTLSVPMLQFDLGEEIDQLENEDACFSGAGRGSKTLVKHDDLRIVLIAMKANSRMHEHKATARISIQTLTGHVQVHLLGRTLDLPAGHLLVLDQCLPHDVEALQESSVLLTLSWPGESAVESCKSHRTAS